MSLKKMTATISHIIDLSVTSKEMILTLPQPLGFTAGAFVNVFMDINGESVRRAYSISSSDEVQDTISLSLRLSTDGVMTPYIWRTDTTGTTVELMGPMGMNTADKMHSKKVYLFSFGIGNGVVRSILFHLIKRQNMEKIMVVTGNRDEGDIVHRDFFDDAAARFPHIEVQHFVPTEGAQLPVHSGFIPDHLSQFDFNHADVYVCGREAACNAVVAKVKEHDPIECNFFIEAFH